MKNYSNYHSASVSSKLVSDGTFILNRMLQEHGSYEVKINNEYLSRVAIFEHFNSRVGTEKNVIGKIEDIEIGNLIERDNENWLVFTFPEDNGIYRKARLRACNSLFPIQSPPIKTLAGYDHLNRPVYEEVAGEVELIPCITEKKLFAFGVDQAINIPDNQIMVTIPFRQHESIKIGKQFTVDEEIYEIRDVDKTKVFNNVGLLVITGERRGDE